MNIIGHVEGKTCVLIDDMIDTAGTITLAANALKTSWCKSVYASCTHPVLSGPALQRIEDSAIEHSKLLIQFSCQKIVNLKNWTKSVLKCIDGRSNQTNP